LSSVSFRRMFSTKRSSLNNTVSCLVLLAVLSVGLFVAIPPTLALNGARPSTWDFLDGDLLISYSPYNETSMAFDPCRIVHYGYDHSYIQTIAEVDSPDWDYQTRCFSAMAFDSSGNLFVLEKRLQIDTELSAVAVISGPLSPHTFMYRFNIPSPYYGARSLVFDRAYNYLCMPSWNLYVGCQHNRTNLWGHGGIVKFTHSGECLAMYEAEWEEPTSGAEFIELNQTDQETILYACEGEMIHRYNVTGQTQMSNFTGIDSASLYDVKMLPDGGVLVASGGAVRRLNKDGVQIGLYQIPGELALYSLALGIDGTSFYVGSAMDLCGTGLGKLYQFDIETGNLMGTTSMPCLSGYGCIRGIAVYQTVEFKGILDPVFPFDVIGKFRFMDNIQIPDRPHAGIKTIHELNVSKLKSFTANVISPWQIGVVGELVKPLEIGSFVLEAELFIPGRGNCTTKFYYYIQVNPHARADFWPMAGKSPSHTGLSASTVPQTNRTRWTSSASSAIDYSPAIANGVVFLARNDSITALNETTGDQLWQYTPYSHKVTSSPAVDDGRVFFGTSQGLIVINETTGSFLWQYGSTLVDSSPVVDKGKIYFGSGSTLCIVDATGHLVGSYLANGPIHTSPAVYEGLVFFGTETMMYSISGVGGLRWMQPLSVRSSPTFANQVVFIGCSDGVYALDAKYGTSVWSFSTTAPVYSSPALADGMVFFGCNDHHIYALNATNKAVIWSEDVGEEVKASPVVAGERVIWGYSWTKGECRDKDTGQLLWELSTGGDIDASPVVAYGHVFFGDVNGNFYSIGPEHDVSVNVVKSSKTVVGQGYTVPIEVQAENLGGDTESFYLSARHVLGLTRGFIAEYQITLSPSSADVFSISWNTASVEMGNYSISGYAESVPGETSTLDNILAGGWVVVTIPGDVQGDFIVDIYDAILLAGHFSQTPINPLWNANVDINGDNIVDIYDAIILAGHFNQHYP
jgi:outer membrane protein assembly factor BamB